MSNLLSIFVQILSKSFIVCICLFPIYTFAYTPKEGNVSAVFGPFFNQTVFQGSRLGTNPPVLGGGALIAQGDVNDYGSLEIGMFHFNKIYYRDEAANFLAEQTQLLQFTMGYRYWWNSRFSTALAIFSAYAMGDPSVVQSSIAPGQEFNTSAQDASENGLDFSIEYEIWASGRYGLLLDARYSKSFSSKHDEYADHYGILLGARYFIQEKQNRDK